MLKSLRFTPVHVAVIAYTLIALIFTDSVQSQDFGTIMKELDRIEATLAASIAANAKKHEQALDELRKAQKVVSTDELRTLTAKLDSLQIVVARLAEQTSALAAQSSSPAGSIASFTELEVLKTELALLREKVSGVERQSVASSGSVLPRPIDLNSQTTDQSASTELSINGFVDASGVGDNRSNQATFGLNQVEVDAVKEFDQRVSARADVEFISGLDGSFAFDIEQGYISLGLDRSATWQLSFGKFNAPIGLEATDPHEMWQYSWGLTGTTLPSNLTGLLLSGPLSPSLSISAYAVNGWDLNADNNKGKTFGLLAEYAFNKQLAISFGAISGSEQDTIAGSIRSMLDFVGSGSLGPIDYGFEYLTGVESKLRVDGGDITWNSGLISAKWNFAPNWALLSRYSQLSDKDGVWTGGNQRMTEFTLSPSYVPVPGLTLLAEIRFDQATSPQFADINGNLSDRQTSTAMELTYAF